MPLRRTITFNQIAAQTIGTPLTLSATASSGLAVSFASTTSGVCMVAAAGSGWQATFIRVGSCTINATQAGNSTYAAATMVAVSFQVSASSLTPQTISFGAIAAQNGWYATYSKRDGQFRLAVGFTSTTSGFARKWYDSDIYSGRNVHDRCNSDG